MLREIAADWFVLSTTQMILLDAETKGIIDMPDTLLELKAIVQPVAITANKELQ
jgi:pseudouridine-5'-phosphate glycosidase